MIFEMVESTRFSVTFRFAITISRFVLTNFNLFRKINEITAYWVNPKNIFRKIYFVQNENSLSSIDFKPQITFVTSFNISFNRNSYRKINENTDRRIKTKEPFDRKIYFEQNNVTLRNVILPVAKNCIFLYFFMFI